MFAYFNCTKHYIFCFLFITWFCCRAGYHPYSSLPVPEGAYKRAGEGLFTRAWSDRTRGTGLKLEKGRLRLAVRKKLFTVRFVRPWPRLPREAVAAPSLAVFKARLDGALSNLGWWKMSLPMAGCWNEMIFKDLSNPNRSVILWSYCSFTDNLYHTTWQCPTNVGFPKCAFHPVSPQPLKTAPNHLFTTLFALSTKIRHTASFFFFPSVSCSDFLLRQKDKL